VDPRPLGGGPPALAALQSNQTQLADITGSVIASADAAGSDILALATLDPVYPYVLEAPASIKTPDDLRGQGIAVRAFGDATDVAARVALRLGLPHPLTPETAQVAISRQKQRERLTEEGIPQPRSIVCRSLAEVTRAAEELGYPVVVEAPNRAGERGVGLARDRDMLAAAATDALADARGEYCLVEELVGGRIVTVNAFSLRGRFVPLTITDREQAPPPAFGVPLAQLWPAALDPAEVGTAVEIAAAAARAVGVELGPTTTQILLGENGPLLAKLSARVGGGHDAELCRVALGVDLNSLAVTVALGGEVHPQSLAVTSGVEAACVRFLVAPAGELQDVRGLEEAYELEGVRGIRIYRKAGHVFHELRRASDRAGAVLATGDTPADALMHADQAAARIRFVTGRVEAVA